MRVIGGAEIGDSMGGGTTKWRRLLLTDWESGPGSVVALLEWEYRDRPLKDEGTKGQRDEGRVTESMHCQRAAKHKCSCKGVAKTIARASGHSSRCPKSERLSGSWD